MNKKTISQELYDNLCLSLGRNAKALKGDAGFSTIKKRLERSARISFEGVEVDTIYLEMAQEALARIVDVNGKKYDTTLDRIVLLDLKDALAPQDALPEASEAASEKEKLTPITPDQPLAPVRGYEPVFRDPRGSRLLDLKPKPILEPAAITDDEKAKEQADFDARRAAMGPPPEGCIWYPDIDGGFYPGPCPKALDAQDERAMREGRF